PVLGDGGYLIELERRGYVHSGSDQEKVGTGRGSGTFTPEVAIEHPAALRGLHEEFLRAGSRVLQALTFFATRAKLDRAGYGQETEDINRAAVRIAREASGSAALVAGSVSRTQLFEREGPSAAAHVRDLLREQIGFLKDAGVDFLILETFFHLAEMRIALEEAARSGLPYIATFSFRPAVDQTTDGASAEEAAQVVAGAGALAVGANCEQEPSRMLPVLRRMRGVLPEGVGLAAQPAALRTTDERPYFTGMPEFPDALETIQIPRRAFLEFGRIARAEGIHFVGGCCGCNAAYIRALANGLSQD
ncbi:MAG TPA: homocysteine S-methyltransferase family protein, partial [Polyangiaceae bacterium]